MRTAADDNANRERLIAILEDFSHAMLISRGDSGYPHGRPLAIAKLDRGGETLVRYKP